MSCSDEQQQQGENALSFSELRAKFVHSNGEGGEQKQENGKTLAAKKRMFESNGTVPQQLKPQRKAPPPPRKTKEGPILSLPLSSPSSPPNGDERGQSETVKNVIKRFNQIGPRLFGPDTPSADWLVHQQQRMTLGRLREQDEAEPADSANEAESNSEEEEDLEKEEYSNLSDATATTAGERTSKRRSSIGKFDTLQAGIIQEILKKFEASRGLPSDIGKLRAQRTRKMVCASDPPTSAALDGLGLGKCQTVPSQVGGREESGGSPLSLHLPGTSAAKSRRRAGAREGPKSKTASVASSQSSSTLEDEHSPLEVLQIPRYETGDEKEDKRLRELHSVALEFYQVQRTYVDLLFHIGESYMKYLLECEQKMNKRWLLPQGPNTPHVIKRISDQFQLILNVHKIFLDDFSAKVAKWDSTKPDMAEVFQRKGDFLKICNNFLKEKRTLTEEFQQVLDENRELADATRKFEQGVLNGQEQGGGGGGHNCGGNAMNMRGISIVMQLDAVHQNVVRYKLLMERYRKYVPDTLVEANIADEALKKLTDVSNTVNKFLAGSDADNKLLELHRKLQGVFNVFAPGRKLLHEGQLRKQTRKELQSRYLLLFTDTLLICRYSATLGGADCFDASKLYQIPIEKVRLHVEEHEDYEQEFVVQSPKLSNAFVARSKRERDVWVQRISEAIRTAKETKSLRRSIARMGTIDGTFVGGGGHPQLEEQPSMDSNAGNHGGGHSSDQSLAQQQSSPQSCEESPEVEQKPFSFGPTAQANGAHAPSSPAPSAPLPLSIQSVNHRQRYEALWIPDNKATKCLMAGCDTRFSVLRRKHHCRQCGWLICNKCVGQAPVRIKRWERVKVCPQCFQENKDAFEQGRLFPASMLHTFSPEPAQPCPQSEPTIPAEGECHTSQPAQKEAKAAIRFKLDDPNLRIRYEDGARLVPPSELFIAPANGILSKARIPVKEKAPGEQPLASGKVYLRSRKGVPTLRWARLTPEFFLQFYEAEFDDQPSESFFVYGYSVGFEETEDGGMVIGLTHKNQIQTERKEDQIVFHVLHSRSAEKWLGTLQKALAIEEPLEEGEEGEGGHKLELDKPNGMD